MTTLRIPNSTVGYISQSAFEMEEEVNWIFRNRLSLTIEGTNEAMLRKVIERCEYMATTLRESLDREAVQHPVNLIAAE